MIMPDMIFDTALERIIKEKINPPFINLYGFGEPLTDQNILRRVRKIKRHFPEAIIRLSSNFNLACDEIIEDLLSSGLDSINISINATEAETYAKIMGLDYYRSLRNIERLIERRRQLNSRLYINVSLVLAQEVKGQVKEFIRQWGAKVDKVIIIPESKWEDGEAKTEDRFPAYYPCNILFERIAIQSNGDYTLCCRDYEGSIGKNIMRDEILGAFYSNPFNSLRDTHLHGDISSVHMCNTCGLARNLGVIWLLRNFAQQYTI